MYYEYKHMEELNGVVHPDFTKYNNNLILYGAGINGALCAFALQERGVDFLCFCDSAPSKQNTSYLGYPVYSPQECKIKYPNAAILFDVYCPSKNLENLHAIGYTEIFFPASLFINLDCDKAAKYISKHLGTGDDGYTFRDQIDAMQVYEWIDEYMIRGIGYVNHQESISRSVNLELTSKCTLRCKNCLALKPYYTSYNDLSWGEMEQVIDRLLELNWFRRFHLLGGEPFLCDYLDLVLKKLCSNNQIEHINIITNGTVLPHKKILPYLQNPKIMVRVSYYGKLSSHYQELEDLCRRWNIGIRVHAQRWMDIGRPLEFRNNTIATQACFSECSQRAGAFFYVLNGNVTLCPFAANTYELGLYDSDGEDIFNILQTDSSKRLWTKLNELYWREAPLGACYYCNGWLPYATKPVPVAEQYRCNEHPSFPQYD